MNLQPIISDVHKAAFTLSGLMKDDLIKVDDVISILHNHLDSVEESGSVLIHHVDGKIVEKFPSGKEVVIEKAPLKVKESVKTDFTGLPLDPFNPDDYETR